MVVQQKGMFEGFLLKSDFINYCHLLSVLMFQSLKRSWKLLIGGKNLQGSVWNLNSVGSIL